MPAQCTVLLEPSLQLNLPALLLSGLQFLILWPHLSRPRLPCALIFISDPRGMDPSGPGGEAMSTQTDIRQR